MRPGLRYKVMWAAFYLATVIAGSMTPWKHETTLWIGVGIAWAICAYISFRQAPATA